LARIEGDDPRRPQLSRREDELLAAHAAEWKKEVPAWAAKSAEFRRGFISHIGCGPKTFIDKAGGLLARAPVTSLSLSRPLRTDLEALAGCPHLAALRELQLVYCQIAGVGPLLRSPHAAGLRALDLDGLCHFAPAWFNDLAPLFAAPQLANLTGLSLRGIGFSPADLRRFCRLETVRQLEELRLQSVCTSDKTMQELAHGPAAESLGNLRTLILAVGHRLSDRGVQALASAPHLCNLRRLGLTIDTVNDVGMKALAASPHLRRLTDLDLTHTAVSVEGLLALIESPNLPRLGRIDLLDFPGLNDRVPRWLWPRPAGTLRSTVWVSELRHGAATTGRCGAP
jgi:hypothetical protein